MLILSEFVGWSLDTWSRVHFRQWCRRRGCRGNTSAPPKVLIRQKSGQNLWKYGKKSRKIWARMLRHLCSHCVMNDTDCRNTSEFDIFFFMIHMKTFFVWLPKKVLSIFETQIFRVSLSKFGQKSFAPPKIGLPLHLVVSRPIFASLSLERYGPAHS